MCVRARARNVLSRDEKDDRKEQFFSLLFFQRPGKTSRKHGRKQERKSLCGMSRFLQIIIKKKKEREKEEKKKEKVREKEETCRLEVGEMRS